MPVHTWLRSGNDALDGFGVGVFQWIAGPLTLYAWYVTPSTTSVCCVEAEAVRGVRRSRRSAASVVLIDL